MNPAKGIIYLDNASTTRLDPVVWEKMKPYYETYYGNASASYTLGAQSKVAIESARRTVSQLLHAQEGHIFFTSGGTESNNWAIASAIEQYGIRHIITSPMEHKSVLNPIAYWQQKGLVQVHYLSIDGRGEISYPHLEQLLKRYPGALVSLMHGNNEIGTLQDIKQIGTLAHRYAAIFHSDMVQTVAYHPIHLAQLPIHLSTGSAHKFHGPKGIGFLYVRQDTTTPPLLRGGTQEQNTRAGTENVAAIVGMAEALQRVHARRAQHATHMQHLKTDLYRQLRQAIPSITTYGHPFNPLKGLCHILSLGLPSSYNPETLFLNLDMARIATSAGSACMSGTDQRSHVLEALRIPTQQAVIRVSFSQYSTQEEVDYFVKVLSAL